jgi:hypothetical protein
MLEQSIKTQNLLTSEKLEKTTEGSETFYVLDISLFTSSDRFAECITLIETLEENLSGRETKFVVPDFLEDWFSKINNQEEPPSGMSEIFASWLAPPYSFDHVEEMIRGLEASEDYRRLARTFYQNHQIVSASKYVGDLDQVGSETIHKKDVIQKLGKTLGSIFFQIIAASHKMKAPIVAFNDRLIYLAHRIRMYIEFHKSEFKKRIRKNANVKYTLRIIGVIASLNEIAAVAAQIGVPAEIELHLNTVGVGLLLVADG